MTSAVGGLRRLRSELPLLAIAVGLGVLALLAPAWLKSEPASLPSARLVVADLRGQALVVTDLPDGSVRRIELPGGPHEIVELPDGRVVASLEQAGRLAVVDLDTGAVDAVETGGFPHGLALQGGELLVTDRAIDATRRFDVATWAEVGALIGGSTPHAVVAGPDYVAIASAGDNTLRIDDRALPVSALPETVAISPDGSRLAVAGAFGGRVQWFGVDGTPLLDVPLGERPVRTVFAPDGHTLAVALSAGGEAALVGEDGSVRRVVTGGVPDGLAFDASGAWLFVSDMAGGHVSAVDVASGVAKWRARLGESAGALLLLAP
ncbi:MAG: YncE family protein [Dehalococcoidia bacterium]